MLLIKFHYFNLLRLILFLSMVLLNSARAEILDLNGLDSRLDEISEQVCLKSPNNNIKMTFISETIEELKPKKDLLNFVRLFDVSKEWGDSDLHSEIMQDLKLTEVELIIHTESQGESIQSNYSFVYFIIKDQIHLIILEAFRNADDSPCASSVFLYAIEKLDLFEKIAPSRYESVSYYPLFIYHKNIVTDGPLKELSTNKIKFLSSRKDQVTRQPNYRFTRNLVHSLSKVFKGRFRIDAKEYVIHNSISHLAFGVSIKPPLKRRGDSLFHYCRYTKSRLER